MIKVQQVSKSLFLILFFVVIGTHLFSQSMLFGTTPAGGANNIGILFTVQAGASSYDESFSFSTNGGSNPYNDLFQASNGKLYGMTEFGGQHNEGVLFEFDPSTNNFINQISFALANGGNPKGSLVQSSNGKLYGMTRWGGIHGEGVLFEFDPSTNIYLKKIDFNGSQNGAQPFGSLIQASNGKLYGMTTLGGLNNVGCLFEYDPSENSLNKRFDFSGSDDGTYPYGKLVQASNGKLYGMTSAGGEYGYGSLFEFDVTNNVFTKKIDLGILSGIEPHGSLVAAKNGKLYGITLAGGTGDGVVFEYDPVNNAISPMANFSNSIHGGRPYGSLIQTADDKIYGLTSKGGSNNIGTVFEFNLASKTLTKKADFERASTGSSPFGSLIQTVSGKIYGLASKGGINNVGTLFEFIHSNNSLVNKHNFIAALNGSNPESTLLKASNEKFYGTTKGGGVNDDGVLFEYDPASKQFVKKIDFSAVTNGRSPNGKLIQTTNGKIYGITSYGGANDLGVLFEYTIETNQIVKKVDFSTTLGGFPDGYLVEMTNNKLYGTTLLEGANGYGTFFEYDIINNILSKKTDYEAGNKFLPSGRLTKTNSGNFIGVTASGGLNNQGLIYEYTSTNNTVTKRFDFEAIAHGAYPNGILTEGANNKLYGSTQAGGINNLGVLFEFDHSSNSYTKKYTFNKSEEGLVPISSVVRSANGNLYGLTYYGGVNNTGVLYEFDLINNRYTKKIDFGLEKGAYPVGDLIEVCFKPKALGSISTQNPICIGDVTPVKFSVNSISNIDNYQWSVPNGAIIVSGETSNSIEVDFKNVLPNDYTVSVYGNNICGKGPDSSLPITVNASPATPVATVTNPTCEVATGSIEISVQDSEDEYQFNIGSAFQKNNKQLDMISGDYLITIKNKFGCLSKTTEAKVNNQPRTPSLPEIIAEQPTCDTPSGSINVTVQNVNDQYSFNNGISYQPAGSKSQLAEGNYVVIIKSLEGCESESTSATINPPLPIPFKPVTEITHPTCTDPTGTIKIIIQNADDQYSFDNGIVFQDSPIKSSMSSGNYQIAIKNSSGCLAKSEASILPDPKPSKPIIDVNLSNPAEPVLSVGTYENYQWYLNEKLIPGATSKSHLAKEDGAYTIIVKSKGCESDPSLPVSIVIVGLKEKQYTENNLVFPNPSSNMITVSLSKLKKQGPAVAFIYNLMGKMIYQTSQSSLEDFNINIADYADGVYLIVIQQEENYIKTQFIKNSK